MNKTLRFVTVVAVLLFCAAQFSAQDTVTGAFEGTVTNSQTGEPVAGAKVEIINRQTGLAVEKTANARGVFFQGLLAPGAYTIRVSAPGFAAREVEQLLRIARTGEVVPVPVALDPASAAATATPLTAQDTDVRASRNTLDAQRSGSFAESEVRALPLGGTTLTRTFDEFTLLLPGVLPPPQTAGVTAGPGQGPGVGSAGQFVINGLRSRGNNFTVDGSDNNDEDIGVRRQGFFSLTSQPIESVKEYQAIILLPPAQFGRNLGGQVNAVSKSGGREIHGSAYGLFNASQLNSRNFFDTAFGNATTPLTAAGRPVIFAGRQVTATNQSGGEDSLTLATGGATLGGPVFTKGNGRGLFYFLSGEFQRLNATKEASFAVPTVEQRGLFGTGATGIATDPFTGRQVRAFPSRVAGDAIFSLYPFANNPQGIYGANTFTQTLPASAEGRVLSGKLDGNFLAGGRAQSVTARYNFTDDFRALPVTGGALFSSLQPRVRTNNLSLFLNSEISAPGSESPLFNQVRVSYGRTKLRFDELRDTQFLTPSSLPANQGQFLLNTLARVNNTLPGAANVVYGTFFDFSVEDLLGPVGQVNIAGFSPVGVDVFNFPQRRVNNTYQLADSLTWRVGAHALGFGGDFRRSELNSDLPRNARPLITFNGAPRVVNNQFQGFFNPLDLAAAAAPSGFFQAVTPGGATAISLRFFQNNFYFQDEWRARRDLSLSLGLRYEYNTPPRERSGRIENTFNNPALNLVPGLRSFIGGRTQIFDPDRNNFAPRVGFAYSPNRDSVIRAGYGVFYDQILGLVVSQSRNVFPTFLTLNLAGGTPTGNNIGFNIQPPTLPFFPCATASTGFVSLTEFGTLNTLAAGTPLSCLVAANNSFPGGFEITLPERNLSTPTAQQYSVTFEQQINANAVASVAYVGTQGRHLLRLTTPNLGPNAFLIPTGITISSFEPQAFGVALGPGQTVAANGAITGGRPTAQAGAVTIYEASANSRYDSLQLQLRGRLRRALQYQFSYSYSRAEDDVSDVFDVAGASALPQNSRTFAGERARANFDAPHRFTYYFVFDVPQARGLQLSGTGSAQSGQPFTVNSIFDVNLDGNLTDRLNSANGLTVTGNGRQPLVVAGDPSALLAPIGRDGAVGRNTFRAGGFVELNFAVSKNFSLWRQHLVNLRADFFNATNRANFGVPARFLGAVGFGQAIETVTPGRRVQFALRYQF
jgi:hypothetical protein